MDAQQRDGGKEAALPIEVVDLTMDSDDSEDEMTRIRRAIFDTGLFSFVYCGVFAVLILLPNTVKQEEDKEDGQQEQEPHEEEQKQEDQMEQEPQQEEQKQEQREEQQRDVFRPSVPLPGRRASVVPLIASMPPVPPSRDRVKRPASCPREVVFLPAPVPPIIAMQSPAPPPQQMPPPPPPQQPLPLPPPPPACQRPVIPVQHMQPPSLPFVGGIDLPVSVPISQLLPERPPVPVVQAPVIRMPPPSPPRQGGGKIGRGGVAGKSPRKNSVYMQGNVSFCFCVFLGSVELMCIFVGRGE